MRVKLNQMCAREAMITLAGKPGHGEQPRWLAKVADAANISKRAARDLWRGDISDHSHRAAIAVQRAVELKQMRAEKDALAAQLESVVGGLHVRDQDFHREDILALVGAIRTLRALDSA